MSIRPMDVFGGPEAVHFRIPGPVVGKQRPRTVVKKGGARTYTPKKTRSYEKAVGYSAKGAGVEKIEGPVAIRIHAFKKRPQSLHRKKDPDGPILCPKRPDWDNIAKAICDGLDGIAWEDDGQVVFSVVQTFYAAKDVDPEVCVTVAPYHSDRPE